jgi:hypothetical protein
MGICGSSKEKSSRKRPSPVNSVAAEVYEAPAPRMSVEDQMLASANPQLYYEVIEIRDQLKMLFEKYRLGSKPVGNLYHTNGIVAYEGHIREDVMILGDNDTKEGLGTEWDAHGRKIYQGTYINNLYHGENCKIFYTAATLEPQVANGQAFQFGAIKENLNE